MSNIYKEVSMSEYNSWSLKLSNTNPTKKDLEKFETEIKTWNLYDLTFNQTDENNMMYQIREYGIPTPHLQLYLNKYLSPEIDFSENGITNLKITPHNEEFRSVILNDGTRQGDFDRHPESMIRNLRNWKEMLKSK